MANIMVRQEVIDCLQAKIAISSVSVDNDNYQISMTIGETRELIAILKLELEPTEFTGPFRAALLISKSDPWLCWTDSDEKALKACDIIDSQAARIKELEEMLRLL